MMPSYLKQIKRNKIFCASAIFSQIIRVHTVRDFQLLFDVQ